MTLDALIMLAGALVAVVPFLGFPPSWDTWIFFVLGVFILGLGIIVRRRGMNSHKGIDVHFKQPQPTSMPLDDGEVS